MRGPDCKFTRQGKITESKENNSKGNTSISALNKSQNQ